MTKDGGGRQKYHADLNECLFASDSRRCVLLNDSTTRVYIEVQSILMDRNKI